jgi:hypothetical protein
MARLLFQNKVLRRQAVLTFAVAALFSGCAGYKLGPTNGMVAGSKSIQILPFTNRTLEPRLSVPVADAIRKAVQKDGTYKLNTGRDPDLIVRGTVTEFTRSPLSFQPSDTVSVRDYALSMVARLVVTERSSGKVVLDKTVSGRATISVGSDLASGEREAIPILAQDLARNAASVLVDGTW